MRKGLIADKQTTSQHAPSLSGQIGWMRLLSRRIKIGTG